MVLIPTQTNTQIQAKEAEEATHKKEVAQISQASPTFESDLAAHIRAAWEKATWEKQKFHQQMVENLNQIHGEYEPDKLAAIRELGSEIYPLITDVKCRTTIGIIRRVLKEKPWGIEPTPLPTLTPELEKMAETIFMTEAQNWISQIAQTAEAGGNPQEVQKQIIHMIPKFKQKFIALQKKIAKEKAQRMEDKINDQLTEGGYYKALNDCVEDLIKLKACFLKGPIYRKKTVRTIKAGANGKAVVGKKEEVIPEWEAPSPFDIYPLPGVIDINKGGLIEKLRYTRQDIQGMIGLEGFDEVAIREILANFYTKGLHEWSWETREIQREEAQGAEVSQFYDWDTIDCLEYHDAVPGRFLLQWQGIPIKDNKEKQVERILDHDIDRDFDYNITAWLIDRWVIKVSINDDPLGLKPYYKSSYVGEKGSFWGRGQPETIKDAQQMCAQTARAVQNNVGISSGPIVSYDYNSLPPGMNFPAQISPWMIIPMTRKLFATTEQKLIEFYQANMHAQELMSVYKDWEKQADSRSVPGFAHGDPNVTGAGNTLGGLTILMGQQSVSIEDIMGELDENIIEPSITAQYWANYDLDDALEYIGDIKIKAEGAKIVLREQQQILRLTEWGRTTANPIDARIMGEGGRRYYLKETARLMALDPDEAVPDKDMTEAIPIPQKGMVPLEGEQRLDQAGNPTQGTEYMLPKGQGG
jgi:hypothetical protein